MSRDYYIFSNGDLKRKENTIYFIDENQQKRSLPIEQVDKLHIFGEISLNTKLLNYLTEYGLELNFYNYYGFYSGTYYPRKKKVSGYLIVNQAMHYNFYDNILYIAKCFIESAAHHILRNLRRYKENTEDYMQIEIERDNAMKAETIEQLMGRRAYEKIYYESFKVFLRQDFGLTEGRKDHQQIRLTLISFGNSLMYTGILGEIYKTQLEPTISFLHQPSTNRFSLCLDIAEIFKPLIVDTVIFSMINNRMINKADFEQQNGICFLNDNGKKKFVSEYEKKLDTTIKHRKLNRKVSYRTLILLECYKLIKHFTGDEIYRPLKAWW